MITVTWLGNAGFRIQTDHTFLIDPFEEWIDDRQPINFDDSIILITHGHIDHLYTVAMRPHCGQIYCTKTPAKTLFKYGWNRDIHVIAPEQELQFDKTTVRIYPGKHIRFDWPLIKETLNYQRFIEYKSNLPKLLKTFYFKEAKETIIYEIIYEGQSIVVIGSLGIGHHYPFHPDLLILPFQGSSKLESKAMSIIDKIQPNTLILSHFNDAFPPISKDVDTSLLEQQLKDRYPECHYIKPDYLTPMSF